MGDRISSKYMNNIEKNSPPASLGEARLGFRGTIRAIEADRAQGTLPASELEKRLLELGFTEGMSVAILHEGPIAHDPIAVRVGSATFALRRSEARAILVDATP